jgi:phosphoglycolate phosphatase-like HAD superfamily hydrolase
MKPVCVDLDGTLIDEDVTQKALKIYVKRDFLNIFRVILWLLHGRAYLKHQLAQSVKLDVGSLRYNDNLLKYIAEKKNAGCKIFLATACNWDYAEDIADHLGIFDGVFASNDCVNLRAEAKALALVTMFGENGFVYVGNSHDDVCVWDKSAECIVVSPSVGVLWRMRNRPYLLLK